MNYRCAGISWHAVGLITNGRKSPALFISRARLADTTALYPIYTDPAQPVDIPFGLRRLHAITLSDEVSLRSASARLLRTFDRDRAKFRRQAGRPIPNRRPAAATIPLEYGDERKDAEFPI